MYKDLRYNNPKATSITGFVLLPGLTSNGLFKEDDDGKLYNPDITKLYNEYVGDPQAAMNNLDWNISLGLLALSPYMVPMVLRTPPRKRDVRRANIQLRFIWEFRDFLTARYMSTNMASWKRMVHLSRPDMADYHALELYDDLHVHKSNYNPSYSDRDICDIITELTSEEKHTVLLLEGLYLMYGKHKPINSAKMYA